MPHRSASWVTVQGTAITRKGELAIPQSESLLRVKSGMAKYAPGMDVELEPEQPPAVAEAAAALLAIEPPAADPWWLAGLAESLDA